MALGRIPAQLGSLPRCLREGEESCTRHHRVLAAVLEEHAPRPCLRHPAQRIDRTELAPDRRAKALWSLRGVLLDARGAAGEKVERLQARLDAGEDRADPGAGAPPHETD